jgi:hypothetical protein
MSGSGHAARTAALPAGVVMSPGTGVARPPAARIAAAVASSASTPRAVMNTCTPSRASASAQPRPSPLLAAHTIAFLPASPRSICVSRRS